MKPILKNNGVIIKTRDYKDNSKIITILTEEGMVMLLNLVHCVKRPSSIFLSPFGSSTVVRLIQPSNAL